MARKALSGSEGVMQVLSDIAKRMGGGSVQVGFLENATYGDGTPVAAVAFWAEYGHGGQFPAPPRPFFRNMIAKESPTWAGKMANLAKRNNYDGPKTLGMMGADITGALQESINDFSTPAISKTTARLRLKYGNKPENIDASAVLQAQMDVAEGLPVATGTQAHPLIWTGHLLNSVAYKVKA